MIAAMGVFLHYDNGWSGFLSGIYSWYFLHCSMYALTEYSIPLAIIGGIAAGAAIGALNGYFYVFRKIKSFIVTICTMFLFRGFIKYFTTNAPVAGFCKADQL